MNEYSEAAYYLDIYENEKSEDAVAEGQVETHGTAQPPDMGPAPGKETSTVLSSSGPQPLPDMETTATDVSSRALPSSPAGKQQCLREYEVSTRGGVPLRHGRYARDFGGTRLCTL